jgi:arabinose-5-phosphate isomerase
MSLETARRVLRIEAAAIENLLTRLDDRFDRAVELLFDCRGRVAVTGMGKSGLIGRKIAATFSSTGTPSFFLHAAEALHGDLGMLVREDVVLALSYGGETEEIVALLPTIQRIEAPIIALTGKLDSTLGKAASVALDVSVKEEACSLNLAPTASTTAALAMGDALAVALLDRRGFSSDHFAALHPSGRLGKKLMRVEALMHSGDALPSVGTDVKMPDVIYEMSKKGLGMTTVLDGDGKLAGIVTDGDLRRIMQKRRGETLDLTAAETMTRNPVTIAVNELASTALALMERRKITSIVVVDGNSRVAGVVHLHDLWTLEPY